MKQILAIRKDVKLTKGDFLKVMATASLESAKKSEKNSGKKFQDWLRKGQKKVTIRVDSLKEMELLRNILLDKKIIVVEIDQGLESIKVQRNNEIIALGIGPELDKILDPITSSYKLI